MDSDEQEGRSWVLGCLTAGAFTALLVVLTFLITFLWVTLR